jgi:hypothetical protein
MRFLRRLRLFWQSGDWPFDFSLCTKLLQIASTVCIDKQRENSHHVTTIFVFSDYEDLIWKKKSVELSKNWFASHSRILISVLKKPSDADIASQSLGWKPNSFDLNHLTLVQICLLLSLIADLILLNYIGSRSGMSDPLGLTQPTRCSFGRTQHGAWMFYKLGVSSF